ncbi:hypothetical protein [Cohnella thailandensis]|uniref:Uncharacterized protein n=1 Tax=Cohnella thailandensis TaxID=557557 RepID=A0A841T483_9BACL|nr:hypothetical protein [Cohnella thailandensis]MBB6637445.1 hypothetical protein [Cohnella thailandensis]MBP1976775.1 hypothetical protein [Cohnella thailandensis]
MNFRRIRWGRTIVALVVALILSLPHHAGAASVTLTGTTQTAWGKLVAFADDAQSAKLVSQMNDFRSLQTQEESMDAKIQALHYSNEEELTVTKNKIKTIRAAKIASLEAKVKKTEESYRPLLDKYKLLTQQISAAGTIGSKTLKSVLQAQANLLKPAVALAKADIKARKSELQTEKAAVSKIAASIRTTLKEIDTVKVQIRAAKSGASSSKSALSSLLKTFNSAVKKPDVKTSSSTLTSMLSLYTKLVEYKQKNYAYEQKITAILNKAKLQFPSS